MQTPPGPGDIPPVSALALVLVELDGVAAKLIASHTRDDRGYCRSCSMAQSGPQVWPCTLYATAIAAERIGQQRRLPEVGR